MERQKRPQRPSIGLSFHIGKQANTKGEEEAKQSGMLLHVKLTVFNRKGICVIEYENELGYRIL